MRPPIPGYHRYISFVDSKDEKFYGCGETGAIRRDENNLFRNIALIIKKYSHRELCYSKTESDWIANADEPDNMDELIDQEDVDEITDIERG